MNSSEINKTFQFKKNVNLHSFKNTKVPENEKITMGEYLFVLNTKKFPIVSYNKAVFKIYDLKQEQDLLTHNLGSLSPDKRKATVRQMVIKLIQKGVL